MSALPSYNASASLPPTYTPQPTPSTPASPTVETSSIALPEYTRSSTTEPHTLSRTLFHWGFLCPFLWMLGISILWIDLTVDEQAEERTEEGEAPSVEELVKRERERHLMHEKIGIVRKAELRWSRYCVVALSIEVVVILIIVGIVVAASIPGN